MFSLGQMQFEKVKLNNDDIRAHGKQGTPQQPSLFGKGPLVDPIEYAEIL